MSSDVAGPTIALVVGLLGPLNLAAQSTHLSALESIAPAPVTEPTAGTFSFGLASLWLTPVGSPKATGAFFSVYRASLNQVALFQSVLAFHLGPRWSMLYGATQINNLFDTSLTNLDPTLENLRAQAQWIGIDGTVGGSMRSLSAGLGYARDDNVGDVQNSTTARVGISLRPSVARWLSIDAQHSRVVGGSMARARTGRQRLSFSVGREFAKTSVSFSVAVQQGQLWPYSEIRSGYGAAGIVNFGAFDFSAGIGSYRTGYGTSLREVYESLSGAILLSHVHVGMRLTNTRLGYGSGYGVSIGFEPESRK